MPRVLVVDDEPQLLKLIERFLARLGYEVEPHSDPVAALRTFESNPRQYDVVMADLSMPNMPGQQLIGKLLIVDPKVRILVCSGGVFATGEVAGLSPGQIRYLEKPFTPDKLTSAIEQLLQGTG